MTRKTGWLQWTTLAIATAIFITPVAYSGGKFNAFAKRGVPASSQVATKQPQHDRFIITYRSGANKASAAQIRQEMASAAKALGIGITPARTLATGGALIRTDRRLDKSDSKRLMIELMKNPDVLAVEPDIKLQRAFVPNDPLYAQQWHYKNGPGGINLEPAWDIGKGDGVVVAVIDTGITPHSELTANLVPGYDFIGLDPDGTAETAIDGDGRDPDPNDPGDWHNGECNIFGIPEDSSWHGTHVAGTIAAVTDNGAGVAGVAPGAKVQPLRALGKCGGYLSDIADAVIWASGGEVPGIPNNATPAEIVNMSLGGSAACSAAFQTAISGAVSRGTTVVVAAGNAGGSVESFTPANCENVIAVAAVGPTGGVASYSNTGGRVDVAAPGGTAAAPAEDNVLSTLNLGTTVQGAEGYAWYAGTSMASPHVAGTVALMQSVAATPKTPAEIERILKNTAYASGGFPAGCDFFKPCGTGIIDARAAAAVASGAEPLPADPPPIPPPPAVALDNGVTVTSIEVEEDGNLLYTLEVPNGASNLLFAMYGGTGDADMYIRRGQIPTNSAFDCRPFRFGNDETCFFPAPASGTWYVRINGFSEASGISLYPSFVDANWPRGEAVTVTQLSNHRTRVLLTWEKGKRNVDIYRNGSIFASRRNRGTFTDNFRIVGSGAFIYKICNQGTQECSNEVEAEWTSRP